MGLNANAAAEDLPQGATSLRIERGACWDRNQLAAELVASCQHWWAVLEAKGFAPIREAWLHSACWLDRQVVVTGEGGHWTGTLLGIDQWGRLRLATGEGEHVISAGDVSLRVADGAG